jgi:hypothetical protein
MSVDALTSPAKADLFEIRSYIGDGSEAPERGHSRSDLTTRSLRFWTPTRYPNYTVVSQPDASP